MTISLWGGKIKIMPEKEEAPVPPVQEVQQPPELPKKKSKFPIIVISLIAILLIGGGVIYAVRRLTQPKICTLEAKICPDGSTVGRVLPNCEFAPCPTQGPPPPTTTTTTAPDDTANWKTYTDAVAGFELKYPANWSYLVKSSTTTSSGQQGKEIYSGSLSFFGPEGQIELVFGDGFGGGPCAEMKTGGKLVDVKIGDHTIPLCNYSEGGKIYYGSPFGDAGGPITSNSSYNFTYSFLESNPQNKNLIDQILSTFKFTE